MAETIEFPVTAEDIDAGSYAAREASGWEAPCAVALAAARHFGHLVGVTYRYIYDHGVVQASGTNARWAMDDITNNNIHLIDAGTHVEPWTVTATLQSF